MYRLLGDLEILREDGTLLPLPASKPLAVLAALLINPNQLSSKAYLLKTAWGDPSTSEAQLHKAINAIRKLLDETGSRQSLMTRQKSGYELKVPSRDLDMLEFRRLVRLADLHGDDEGRLLREALGLWRGPHPLSNIPEPGFQEVRGQLENRRKLAAVRLFDLELAARNYDQTHADAAAVAADFPTDRRLCEQLMIAAYRCGHGTEASQAYSRYEAMLGEETGAAPDPALRDLSYAIGSDDEEAVTRAEEAIVRRAGLTAKPVRAVEPAVPRQLPPRPADFTGRDGLVAEESWLLGRDPEGEPGPPVIVITGPAGIGKSALALEVAHASAGYYPGGQLYLDLGGTTAQPIDPSEALAQFLRAFEVQRVPDLPSERVNSFRSLLAGRRVLIVLDDAASGAQVNDLIPAHPGCAVVITARGPLADMEVRHHSAAPLAPLSTEHAREFFLRRVNSFRIQLDSELDAVDRVVDLCGGLPLALRIAAAQRVHQHPLPTAELAARLARQGVTGLKFGDLNLARAIEAGCSRLEEPAQQLFEDLGVVELRSYATWTAAALLTDADDPAGVLADLAAASILEPADPAVPGVYYRFHELTKAYARDRAGRNQSDLAGRMARVGRAYLALLTLARRAHAALYGGDFEIVHCDEPGWDVSAGILSDVASAPLDWFEAERVNLRAAVSHCAELGMTGICWDLAFTAHEFYTLRRYFDDWYATSSTALQACRAAGDQRGEGVMLTSLGQSALVASRAGKVSGPAELERAAELLASCGDQHGLAIAQRTLASALRRRGEITRPLLLFDEALAGYRDSGDIVGQFLTLRLMGQINLDQEDYDLARARLQAALELASQVSRPRLQAQTWYWVGMACLAAGDMDGAATAFSALREVFPDPPDLGHAYARHGQAELARRTGEHAEARAHLAAAAGLARKTDTWLEGRLYLSEAALHAEEGQAGQQLHALEQAVDCFSGASAYQVQALDELARARAEHGDDRAAREARDQADLLYGEMALPEEDRRYRNRPSLPGDTG